MAKTCGLWLIFMQGSLVFASNSPSTPCSKLAWPNQLYCMLSYAKSVVQGTPEVVPVPAPATVSPEVTHAPPDSPMKMVEMAVGEGDGKNGNIKALFVHQDNSTLRRHKRSPPAAAAPSASTLQHKLPQPMPPTLLTLGSTKIGSGNGTSTVCFSCMASAVGEEFPNENCSFDIVSIEQAVKLNIQMISCPTRCYTNVLRIGSYVTTFRGCYQPDENRKLDGQLSDKGSYQCSKLIIMGAEWWDCHCDGHFCNNKMPDV